MIHSALTIQDISGFNPDLFICRIDKWVIDVLFALPRLHPKLDILGNMEQNATKWSFQKSENKKRIVYWPNIWYTGFQASSDPMET